MYVTDTSLATILRMGVNVQTAQGNLYDRFKVGQILRGAVTAIADDEHVELMLNGHKLVGQTGLNLKTGDAVTVKVMDTDEGVILQLLAPEVSEGEAANSAQAFLRMVGLPGDKFNTQIVLLLASQRTEVSKKEVEVLRDLYEELVGSADGDIDNEQLNALIVLYKHDLPMNRRTLALMKRYNQQAPDFGRHFSQFAELINSTGLPEGWSERLKAFIARESKPGSRIPDTLESLGLFLERQLVRGAYNPELDTLKKFLLEVINWLNANIVSDLSDAKRVQLQYHASELLHVIEYNQVLNTSPHGKDLLWIYLPVLFDGQWQTVQLKLQRRNEEAANVSPEHYRYGVNLTMSALGNVTAEGIVVHSGAQCTFRVRDEYGARICEDHLDEFSTALSSAGIALHQARVILENDTVGDSIFDDATRSFHKAVDRKV